MISKIIVTLPIIGLSIFLGSQYDRGFVGFDRLNVVDVVLPDNSYLTVDFVDASVGWLKSYTKIELEKTAGYLSGPSESERESEKFSHGNSFFEEKYLVTGIIFILCCGTLFILSLFKVILSHESISMVYLPLTLLQIIFSLGILSTSWGIVGLAFNDEDFERRNVEYEDVLTALENNETIPFGTGKKAEDIFEVKWVPIIALIMVLYLLLTEIFIYILGKKKENGEDQQSVEV